MRWDNLRIDTEGTAPGEAAQLPGYRDAATVHRFEAPEALDTRFYEVRAKSALNKVPEASSMPFRWTINPYRGCSHACVYCVGPDTPVLMADGRHRRIADLMPGDRIYGTERRGTYRHFVETEVLAKWDTSKHGYRVTLRDGTELVASGDHRFLSERGWKHVARDPGGAQQRPPLTPSDSLVGVGRLARSPRRDLEGQAIKTSANLGVVSIEPLGPMRMCDITTGTGDFIADGIVSHNCFARPTHTYLDMNAGRDFEKEIVVKVNVPEVLRAELRRSSWNGEHVALGTNTDPYQWVESKYRLMPGIWEALRDARNPCSVLTKSPLLLRDLELFKEIAAVASITANLSIPTIDPKMWRATEPHTPHPRARMEAVAELNRNGIPTGILVAPLMAGINDDPRQVEEILTLAAEAGATGVGGIALHLRGEVRVIFMDWLKSCRPDLVEHYEHLYAQGAYAPAAERSRLSALLRSAPAAAPFSRDPRFVRRRDDPADPAGTSPSRDARLREEVAPLQTTLF